MAFVCSFFGPKWAIIREKEIVLNLTGGKFFLTHFLCFIFSLCTRTKVKSNTIGLRRGIIFQRTQTMNQNLISTAIFAVMSPFDNLIYF